MPVGDSSYNVNPESLSIQNTGCHMDILNTGDSAVLLQAELLTLEENMFRLKIKEKNGLRPRYEVEGALIGEPKQER